MGGQAGARLSLYFISSCLTTPWLKITARGYRRMLQAWGEGGQEAWVLFPALPLTSSECLWASHFTSVL